MKGNNRYWALVSLFLLGAGFGIYGLLRPLPWMPWPGIAGGLPHWLLYGLPDGLWAAAFAAALLGVAPSGTGAGLIWRPTGFLMLQELLQHFGLWPGTADLLDVAWGLGGCGFIFCIYYLQKAWKTGKEKQLTCL
jgi:hypothetical protein